MNLADRKERPDDGRHWAMDKRVNVSHLFATLSMAVAAAMAWSAQNERIAILETRLAAVNAATIVERSAINNSLTEIKSSIRDLRIEIRQERRPFTP